MMRTKVIPTESPVETKTQESPEKSPASRQTLLGDTPTNHKATMSSQPEKTPSPAKPSSTGAPVVNAPVRSTLQECQTQLCAEFDLEDRLWSSAQIWKRIQQWPGGNQGFYANYPGGHTGFTNAIANTKRVARKTSLTGPEWKELILPGIQQISPASIPPAPIPGAAAAAVISSPSLTTASKTVADYLMHLDNVSDRSFSFASIEHRLPGGLKEFYANYPGGEVAFAKAVSATGKSSWTGPEFKKLIMPGVRQISLASTTPAPIPAATKRKKKKMNKKGKTKMPSLAKQQSLVTFIVNSGPDQQTFSVHKDFATFYSPLFDAAFNPENGTTEGETQTMTFKDVDPPVFGKLVHWLYTKELEEDSDDEEYDITITVGLFDLAYDTQIVELQKVVLQNLIEVLKADSNDNLIRFLWEAVQAKRKSAEVLQKLAVDKIAWGTEPEQLAELKKTLAGTPHSEKSWVQDLWSDVALAFSKHYWDGIPGKYFKQWGDIEDYLEIKKEAGELATD